MNLGCRYRSSIAYAILITFLLNGLFFFSENKDMGRFLYETIKKVNARKTSRIVNLNQIGKNKSAVCIWENLHHADLLTAKQLKCVVTG